MIDKKINSAKRWLSLLAALIVAIILFTMTGCNTEKKLTAKAEKFVDKHPKKALPFFRGKFPCIQTSADTTIFTSDTTIYVDCPDTIPAAEYFTLHDTLVRNVYHPGKTIKVPVTLPQKTVTVIKTIEDLSKIAEKDIELNKEKKRAELLADKNKHKGKVIIWLIVAVAGLLVPYIIKAIKFFKL